MQPPSHILWNLFLALVPVALGLLIGWLSWKDRAFKTKWYFWLPLLLLWLGFLPNTCYLLTEWRHFIAQITENPDQTRTAVHQEGDLVAFLALTAFYVMYSSLGLLTFSMAIWPVDQWIKPNRLAKFAFFFVCAVGVYLGLVRRLNTWDVVTHPTWVISSTIAAVLHPFTLALSILFALVIWANYWIFEVFIDGVLLRYHRWRAIGR